MHRLCNHYVFHLIVEGISPCRRSGVYFKAGHSYRGYTLSRIKIFDLVVLMHWLYKCFYEYVISCLETLLSYNHNL
jgi:hypothetical protein